MLRSTCSLKPLWYFVWGAFYTILLLLIFSCNSQDDNSFVEQNEPVNNLDQASDALRKASSSGKVICSVEVAFSKIIIGFSDNSSIIVEEQKSNESITPFLLIDRDSLWNVSYDGSNYRYLTNKSAKTIHAYVDGVLAIRDTDVKILRDEESGHLFFGLYNPKEADKMADRIDTPYEIESSSIIKGIIEDDQTRIIRIVLSNDSEFDFKKEDAPVSIEIEQDVLYLGSKSTASFDFPSYRLAGLNSLRIS